MKNRIHILGASGSGTTTLGASLAEILPHRHLDSDDYFWITKYTEQRAVPERRALLYQDFSRYRQWICSGAVCGWGDDLPSYFDLVIFLWIPPEIRLARLQQREEERYGAAALAGGGRYEQTQAFLEWASLYDQAGMEVRSRTLHEHWMSKLSCPILRIEGDYSNEERISRILNVLK